MTDQADHIQQGLEHDAQQIEVRIPMNQEEYQEAAKQLAEFMRQHDLSNGVVGQALGVSKTTISQFKDGKYKGDVGKLAKKAARYMDNTRRKARRKAGKPGFVETSVARKIKELISNAISFSDIDGEGKVGIIIGDGGHGKSCCLRAYAEVDHNAVYCQLDDLMSARGVFMAIAEAVGLESYGTHEEVGRRVIDAIIHRDTIIMLDECSSLKPSVLNQLRQVIAVKARTPLILAGNHGLLTTITLPTTKRGAESMDQLTSRMMPILDLDDLASQRGDDGGLYSTSEIVKLYQYGGIRLVGGAQKILKNICRTPRSGRLRTCDMVISLLHTSSKIKKAGQITRNDIVAAIVKRNLPIKMWLMPGWESRAGEEEAVAAASAG